MVLLMATLPGLAVAHPNALVNFLMLGYLMLAGVVLGKSWEIRRRHPLQAAASVGSLLAATGLTVAASTRVEFKGGMRRVGTPSPSRGHRQALHDMLLFAQNGGAGLRVLAVLVAVGLVIVIVRGRGYRWVIAALIITDALFYLMVSEDTAIARVFTWPWDNEPVRLAALAALPAILLATVAFATGAGLLKTHLRLPLWASTVTFPLLFVVATGGAYVDAHRQVLEPYFHPVPSMSWANNQELRALRTLGQKIPIHAVVAENPWNGGGYMYIVSGRRMLFPTGTDRTAGDRTLLADSLDDVGSAPLVCAAARRLSVQFAITGGTAFGMARERAFQYGGVDAVGSSGAFHKVASAGPYTLYQMVRCAQA